MTDSFEFDDDDDLLLGAFCIQEEKVSVNPEKRLNDESNENHEMKKVKLDEALNISPVITSNKERPRIQSSKHSSAIGSVKRIFPGPAGLLPDENQSLSQVDICSTLDPTQALHNGPWEEMSKDFKISNNAHLFDKFNIAWIKKEASTNKFFNQKAPFLAGILQSLEVSEGHKQKSINIILKDLTGSIQGTVLQNVYEEHASHFILGSVLVLVQFGVLSCNCEKCDNYHLTITSKNLSAIYSNQQKITIKQYNPLEILMDYYAKIKELEAENKNQNQITPVSSSANNYSLATTVPLMSQNPCSSSFKLSNLSNFTNRPAASTGRPKLQNIRPVSTTKSQNNSLSSNGCTNPITEHFLSSKDFPLPKVRSIDSISISSTSKDLTMPTSITSTSACNTTAPKRLFTFKKRDLSQEPSCSTNQVIQNNNDAISRLSAVQRTSSDKVNVDSDKNSDNKNENKKTSDKDENSFKLENSDISINVANKEHETIWKDVLSDIDVSSLFDDF